MTTHSQARTYAAMTLTTRFSCSPTAGEIAALAGVAFLETCYSDGWKGAGKGSRNQGAIQCGSGWQGARFSYRDTHPIDGSNASKSYPADFRAYPEFVSIDGSTIKGGWNDLVMVVMSNRGRSKVRDAARAGDYRSVSLWLHNTGYYEGFGPTVADRVANHYRALSKAIAAADRACGVEVASIPTLVTIPPTVRRGDRGEAVRHLQWELAIAADGIFGDITKAAVIECQQKHGLVADGVVGPKTWQVLLTDDYVPEAA